jgi:hypothetical protein
VSRKALLLAVRDVLRLSEDEGGLGLLPEVCEVMPDGRPAARAGETFYAVHPSVRRNNATGRAATTLDDEVRVAVTVTRRWGQVPRDRVGTGLFCASGGFEDQIDAVRNCLSARRQAVLAKANAHLDVAGVTVYGFNEAPYPGVDRTFDVGPEWFGEAPADDPEAEPVAGSACEIELAGARRWQPIGGEH